MEIWMWVTGAAVILGTFVFAAFLGIKASRGAKPPVPMPTSLPADSLIESVWGYSKRNKIGDAVYRDGATTWNGTVTPASGIWKVTRIEHLANHITEVFGVLVFPNVLSECMADTIITYLNNPSQCPHYWHHGPERHASDENHIHPEPPKQPSNLVANKQPNNLVANSTGSIQYRQSFLTHNYDSRSEDYDAISDTIIRRP